MNVDFDIIECLFVLLLTELKECFSDSEIQEAQDFIDVGEYGIALDTVLDIIYEEKKILTKEARDLIYRLADLMLIDSSYFDHKLKN